MNIYSVPPVIFLLFTSFALLLYFGPRASLLFAGVVVAVVIIVLVAFFAVNSLLDAEDIKAS